MKIFIVSPTLNHGGAERVAALWAEGFANEGHEVFFVVNVEEGKAYELPENIRVLPLSHGGKNKFVKYANSIKLLRTYYKQYRPNVIIGVMWACSLLAKLATLGLGIPVINTEHNSFERPSQQPMSKTDKLAKFWLNYLYDGITVLTKADQEIIMKRFKHVFVLPNPTFLQPLETVPLKEKVILAAGRLDAWEYKGFDVLIKAWAAVAPPKGWQLQIAGDGSPESFNFLRKLCRENGVEDSVKFLGFRKDIANLYRRSAIFVLSSRYEGFGMVLVEAMSQGCACIVCDYKGRQAEIVTDGENGLLCFPDNVESLASELTKVLHNQELMNTLQKNALCSSCFFSPTEIMTKWNHIMAETIQR